MPNIFILLFLLTFSGLSAQNTFQEIDDESKKVRYKGDLNLLVNELTSGIDDDIDKARAIYVWITENIGYDIKTYNKGKKRITFKCKSQMDCALKQIEFENKLIERALRRKKAICSGYSLLFKRMCDLAKINCQVIDGYIKTKPTHAGRLGVLDHAWNRIEINNEFYYLDLTWASGYVEKYKNDKLKKFIKQRNDFYWLTPIEKLTIDHFPEKTDVIPKTNISKEDFKNQPYIETSIIPLIDLEFPQKGMLTYSVSDTIHFKFKLNKRVDNIQINTNLKRNPKFLFVDKKNKTTFNQKAFNLQRYVSYSRNDSTYEFYYVIDNENLKYIDILWDYEPKIRYLVEIKEPE